MLFTHDIISPTEYTDKTFVQFSVRATANIKITTVTFHSVYSTYVIGEQVRDITLICDNALGSYTINKTPQDLTYETSQILSAGENITFTLRINAGASFGLTEGVDSSLAIESEGSAGILSYSQYNIPHCTITYEISDMPYLHDKDTNDGYFYFDGLSTDYSDYEGKSDWLIDTSKAINEGYPFIEGLATGYSDYEKEDTKGKWYLNSDRLIPYINGSKLQTFFVGRI